MTVDTLEESITPFVERHRAQRLLRVGALLGVAAAIPGIDIVRIGPFRIWHAVIILALLAAFSLVGPKGVARYRPTLIDLFLIMFVLATSILEWVNSSRLEFEPNYGVTLAPLFYYLGFVAVRLVSQRKSDLIPVLSGMVVWAVPSAAIAIGQFLVPAFGQWTVHIASGDGLERRLAGDGLLRAAGLFGHWTGAGFYFSAMIACALVLVNLRRDSGMRAGLAFAVVGTAGLASLVTLTFSVIATVAALIFVFLLGAQKKLPAIFLALIVMALSVPLLAGQLSVRVAEQAYNGSRSFLPEWVPSTLRYRANVWIDQTIPAIQERPLNGWGSGVLTDTASGRILPASLGWSSAESQWFATALGFGVPIMLLLATMIILSVHLARKASRVSGGQARPFFVLVFMALVSSLTVPVFTNRGFPLPFWIIMGVVMAFIHFDHPATRRAIGRVRVSS